ncbi:MAG: DUF1573 domain-containing protein [Saprospiraceae bacterium]|nr:DUF1573 domain-containing protein [Saprospiraceae bacterium]
MKQILFLFLGTFLGLTACGNEPKNGGDAIEEIQTVDPNTPSSIIRNPATANGTSDTLNVAKMEFEETSYDFGTAYEGDIIEKVFKFKNTGRIPLIISEARSTCGCTVPSWPKEPIQPGAENEIKIVFNTENKLGSQTKPITISANTWPGTTVLKVKGKVLEKGK